MVPSPAACLSYLQRPWSSPSSMPTQLGACAGDVAMLAMTVAKPGVADKFQVPAKGIPQAGTEGSNSGSPCITSRIESPSRGFQFRW